MVQLLLKGAFWLGTATVVYVYLLYPVLVWALAGVRRERRGEAGAQPTTAAFSVVLAVHDEAARISSRLDELLTQGRCLGEAKWRRVTSSCLQTPGNVGLPAPSSDCWTISIARK